MKGRRGEIAFLMSWLIIFISVYGPFARAAFAAPEAEEKSGSVYISDEDDLVSLSRLSEVELNTRNRRFIITRDLDMTGRKWTGISIMSGVLDGRGHIVTGLSVSGSSCMVEEVSPGGMILDLKVSGSLKCPDTLGYAGGIAGKNYGTIKDCEFSGQLSGMENTGAIAGINAPSANIINCRVKAGSIRGMTSTGGVAGRNEGNITDSVNYGSVNVFPVTAYTMLGNDDGLDLENSAREVREDVRRLSSSGGIVGMNTGIIRDCVNWGQVGWRHLGYETGGIAGYAQGGIYDCENFGRICGRSGIGGIAGLLEPSVEEVYREDDLDRASGKLGELSSSVEELDRRFGDEDDRAQLYIDSIRYEIDLMRSTVSAYRAYYRTKDDETITAVRERVDEMRSIADNIGGVKDKKARRALNGLRDCLQDSSNILEAAFEALISDIGMETSATIRNVYKVVSMILPYIDDLSEYADDLGRKGKDLSEDLSRITDLMGGLEDYTESRIDSYEADFDNTYTDIKARFDRTADLMEYLSESLENSTDVLNEQIGVIIYELDDLNEILWSAFDSFRDEIDEQKALNSVYDEAVNISDQADTSPGPGRIISCVNGGAVTGDMKCGGIAGYSEINSGFSGEFEVVSSGQISFDSDIYWTALITECTNRGEIEAEGDCCGGIVGDAGRAAVVSCNNYSIVTSKTGEYAGGIAGKSEYVIRDCRSSSVLKAEDYTGGIAGYAGRLYDNISVVTLESPEEINKKGAIAGDMEEDGEARGNIFLQEGLGAVDGITVTNQARGMSYSRLESIPGIPQQMAKMHVFIRRGEELLGQLTVSYGAAISESDLDIVTEALKGKNKEEKKAFYWQGNMEDIRENRVLDLKFPGHVSTLASEAAGEEKPPMLLSGLFYEDAALKIRELTGGELETVEKLLDPSSGAEIVAGYEYMTESSFGEPEGASEAEYTVRLLSDDLDLSAETLVMESEGEIRETAWNEDGSYVVFSDPQLGRQGRFYIRSIRKRVNMIIIYVAAAAGAVLFLIIAALYLKKGSRGRHR